MNAKAFTTAPPIIITTALAILCNLKKVKKQKLFHNIRRNNALLNQYTTCGHRQQCINRKHSNITHIKIYFRCRSSQKFPAKF